MKLIAALLLALTIMSASVESAFTAAGATVKVMAPLLVDVRTQAEWDSGHLDGAILIPYEQIAAEIGKISPDKSTKLYLYCRSGRRTGLALEELKKIGYTDIINLGTMESAAKAMDRKVVK